MNGRDLVLSMLKEIYAGNEFSHILIRQVLEKYDYRMVMKRHLLSV